MRRFYRSARCRAPPDCALGLRKGKVQAFEGPVAYTIGHCLVRSRPVSMKLSSLLSVACLLVAGVVPALAQEHDARNRVVVVENVRYDYAQVLNVEPVFQTLRASRTEEHCEPVSTRTLAPIRVRGAEEKGRFSRLVDSVKGLFGRSEELDEGAVGSVPQTGKTALLTPDCRIVEVGREFRRPIAYDVDYVYKGTKFRSRLPEDPGNRLKLRVSITPHLAETFESEVSP